MKSAIAIPILVGAILFTANQALSKESKKKSDLTSKNEQREITSEKKIEVDIELSMVDLSLSKATGNQAFNIDIEYDADHFEPLVSYKVRGDYGFLELGMEYDECINGHDELGDLFKGVFSDDHKDVENNKWEVYLTDRFPLAIAAEVALGSGELDLTDLQIENLRIEAGLSDMTIKFDKPNPIKMDRLAIEAGLGDFHLENLGNASIKRLNLEVGLGSATIDLSGPINTDMTAEMDVGLGSLELQIPKGLPVKIRCECSFLSSIDLDDFRKKGESTYYSPGFDKDKDYITLNLGVGLGSVKVEWLE